MTEPTAEALVALADRVHFIGRHDGVDPSPGPSSCADTDCMTLRRLIDEVDQARGMLRDWVELYGEENSAITGNTKHFLEEKLATTGGT